MAFIFAMIIRSADILSLSAGFIELASYIVYINILLAFFNLIPIPPLDGSKILSAFLPYGAQLKYQQLSRFMEGYGLLFTFAFIFIFINLLWGPFSIAVFTVFELFTGLGGL
jgi:Zn-dependent protease